MKTIIDKQGDIVEICVIKKDDGGFTDYELKEGERAVDYLNDCQTVTNGVSHPPLKPKWEGEKWIETATTEELQTAYPAQPTPPLTIDEKIENLSGQIAYIGMMTEVV